jgi:hypothetical protein
VELTQYSYGDALIPIEKAICGVVLKPLCLGHLLLLEKTNNPVMSKEEVALGYQDGVYRFFQALLVCALSYEDGCKLLGDTELFLEEWELFQNNLIKNIEREPDWNIYSKLSLFKDYMAYYLDMPFYEVLQKDTGGTKSGTDWKAAIAIIFKKLDYSQSEILNMPMNKLFQEWTANAEAEGQIKVVNKFTADKLKAAKAKAKEK